MTHQLVGIGWMLLASILSASIGLGRPNPRQERRHPLPRPSWAHRHHLMMLISSTVPLRHPHRRQPPATIHARRLTEIVSGIGFLGANLILTRHGAIRANDGHHRETAASA